MTEADVKNVLSYLTGQRGHMVDLLQKLALIESPSDNAAAIAPLLSTVTFELNECDMSVRHWRGRGSAGTLCASARSLVRCACTMAYSSFKASDQPT